MKRLGVVVAMQKEFDALFPGSRGKQAVVFDSNVKAVVSGIGNVNAAIAAYRLISEDHVSSILNIGCAGAASLQLSVGQVVVGGNFVYADKIGGTISANDECAKRSFRSTDYLRYADILKNSPIGKDVVFGATFLTRDHFVEENARGVEPAPFSACFDMESAAIAQVCEKYGIGLTGIRIISDTPLTGGQPYDLFWENANERFFALSKAVLGIDK